MVTDEGLGYLAKLKDMEELDLFGARITDEGAKHLRHMPRLKTLELCGGYNGRGCQTHRRRVQGVDAPEPGPKLSHLGRGGSVSPATRQAGFAQCSTAGYPTKA